MKKNTIKLLSIALLAMPMALTAQQATDYTKQEAAILQQWQHADEKQDNKIGTSSSKAYAELLQSKTPTSVIVAIIDSGTETTHPDLQNRLWTNKGEIPNNGIDDDKNGYADDIHGWSFIGGPGGDVENDLLEFTRIYKELKNKFGSKTPSEIAAADKKDYDRYLKMKMDYDKRVQTATENEQTYNQVKEAWDLCDQVMKDALKKSDYTLEEVKALNPADDQTKAIQQLTIQLMENNLPADFKEWKEQVQSALKYQLNLNYDPRKMVGDNYADSKERYYGNNHIDGPHADHGTHVAGIVGAEHNNIGVDGIADNVQLMIIRCVPNGDERDKDVANAIRYAADNGARIINMSFGKSYSPQKEVVDEAVKYAESKGVLMVHAAGNDGKNSDTSANFPEAKYNDGTYCSTWIEVGASGPDKTELAASFSNYGRKKVDIFSPGVDILSTVPGAIYKPNDGTSMAAPVTAGVAAAIMSYYPNLSAKDVKAILLASASNFGKVKVPMPGNPKKKVKFKKLSVTGGVVNLYSALKMAETWGMVQGKK